ncbi:serine hydrolase [Virgisporangium aliadipatigenens]|uniref:Serine hydrolase n=1 Tax=Virgisporangium aliadipatigenens TaxID=741659 RepID=A0A8J4DNM0_9ACTN|nr:serine hydrolase domain-containing protein [Virgisporangium aliadipatigenens]GIJ45040.1 serine hydrolase [Virgisporangium aliadipatigenens]
MQLKEFSLLRDADRPGVALIDDGGEVHVECHGAAGDGPMRRETPFRIASLTKPLLAAVAMTLVEDGTIALDDPVERWLPELADRRVLTRVDGPLEETVPARRSVTVEDLLTFRMGHGLILDPAGADYPVVRRALELRLTLAQPWPRTPHGPDEWLRRFATLPLVRQPGETWMYNTGSLVLGVLVSRAAARPLPDLMGERLLRPLGMDHTAWRVPPRTAAALPPHYITDPATGELVDQAGPDAEDWTAEPAFHSGAAGLVSTVDDLLAFARMMRAGGAGVLTPESVRAMTTDHLTAAQKADGGFVLNGLGWGYGLAVDPATGRYGWDGGYGTVWFNDPRTGRIGILCTQVSDTLFDGTREEFVRRVTES